MCLPAVWTLCVGAGACVGVELSPPSEVSALGFSRAHLLLIKFSW